MTPDRRQWLDALRPGDEVLVTGLYGGVFTVWSSNPKTLLIDGAGVFRRSDGRRLYSHVGAPASRQLEPAPCTAAQHRTRQELAHRLRGLPWAQMPESRQRDILELAEAWLRQGDA